MAGVRLGDAWDARIGGQSALGHLLARVVLAVGGTFSGWAIANAAERVVTLRREQRRRAAGIPAESPVPNLLPREAYDHLVDPATLNRLGVGLGVYFGACMTVMGLVTHTPFPSVPIILATGTLSGVLFGLFMSRGLPHRLRALTDRLYAGDPRLVPLVPDATLFRYRLQGESALHGRRLVAGTLYIGSTEWRFVPHRLGRQPRKLLRIAPLGGLSLSVVPGPSPGFLWRLFGVRPVPLLQVQWAAGQARFRVPQPEQTLERLRAVME
jgi:hypothetical protein